MLSFSVEIKDAPGSDLGGTFSSIIGFVSSGIGPFTVGSWIFLPLLPIARLIVNTIIEEC